VACSGHNDKLSSHSKTLSFWCSKLAASAARDAFPRDSSLSLRSFGSGSGNGESSGSESKFSADDKYGSTHSSTAMDYQSYTSVIDVMDDTTDDEDYTEPWVRNSYHSDVHFLSASFSSI
jgi:hypothetical protein